MRELKQDWRDLCGGFKVAFDIWKLFLALIGLVVMTLVFWGLLNLPGWVTATIVAAIIVVFLGVKFATSESGFTLTKLLLWVGVLVVVSGLTVLVCLYGELNLLIAPAAMIFFGLLIWALFGGAISRIAVVEISTDDRIGLGEALTYARKKYAAYFGSTILPLVAVLVLMLSTFVYGLLFRLPVVNVILSIFFFLVLIDGFMMFLIFLGGVAGAPLMYPAVSAEGNDAFDAISRCYSYVFGRPWRYLFYNLVAFVYGVTCLFFVGIFVRGMLGLSVGSANVGMGGQWYTEIRPRVLVHLQPMMQQVDNVAGYIRSALVKVDVVGWLVSLYDRVVALLGVHALASAGAPGATESVGAGAAAVIVAVFIYILVGLVLAYGISLFFCLQSTVYLLLRKVVDGADMTEVYLEEEEAEEEFAMASASVQGQEGAASGESTPASEEQKNPEGGKSAKPKEG